jgi:hypothetical protein
MRNVLIKFPLKASLIGLFLVMFSFAAVALNAPYLISADALTDQKVLITWRVNDLSAPSIMILRKATGSSWKAIDSVGTTINKYTDSMLGSGTEYSYSLIARTQSVLSDTSNILSVKTPSLLAAIKQPTISVLWAESKPITITFMDSSTNEKGFRLFRQINDGTWIAIDSQVSTKSTETGSKFFKDSLTIPSTWYRYKVQVYNDSGSLFSSDTAVYTYISPVKNFRYSIDLLATFPAFAKSWMERVGDSIYFPETKPQGNIGISILDISKISSPRFAGYLDTAIIPASIKFSTVGARIACGDTFDYLAKRSGFILVHKFFGLGPSAYSKLYVLDTAMQVRDSMQLPTTYSSARVAGILDDSCYLVDFNQYLLFSRPGYSSNLLQPVRFASGKIDTFPVSTQIIQEGHAGYFRTDRFWGVYSKKAVISRIEYSNTIPSSSYVVTDFAFGYSHPLSFLCMVPETLFSANSPVFDTSISFSCVPNSPGTGATIYAFDIANAHSGPTSAYLGKFVDSGFRGTGINNMLIDTGKKVLVLAGDSTISFYSYSRVSNAVKHGAFNYLLNHDKIKISMAHSFVEFNGLSEQATGISIIDLKGRVVSQIPVSGKKKIVWNKLASNGGKASAGCYIAHVNCSGRFLDAGTFILGN